MRSSINGLLHDAISHAAAIAIAAEVRLDDSHDPPSPRQREMWELVRECSRELTLTIQQLRLLLLRALPAAVLEAQDDGKAPGS